VANGFQAIKFVMIDFDANWERVMLVTGYANIQYTATEDRSRLDVVMEAPVGTLTTYQFQVSKGDVVFVVDQVVHIPDRCVRQQPGNTIRCGD
jgi:hypothetical protein